jgi:hypothetical protein
MGAHTSAIQDLNVFFIAFLFGLCLYIGRSYIFNAIRTRPIFRSLRPLLSHRVFHSQMVSKGFKVALIATFGLGAFLELYYYSWCPVSNSYYQTNLMIAREIITTLNDINALYWPDFATLLNVVRDEEVNPWDHDIDFSMLHPGEEKLEEVLAIFRKHPKLEVAYFPARGLVQLWARGSGGPYGPHADIFLWSVKKQLNNDESWILNDDYTLRITRRKWDEIFPLRTGSWLGRNVTVPKDAHALCRAEYGEGYTTPRLYRLDCLENMLHFRFLPVAEPATA